MALVMSTHFANIFVKIARVTLETWKSKIFIHECQHPRSSASKNHISTKNAPQFCMVTSLGMVSLCDPNSKVVIKGVLPPKSLHWTPIFQNPSWRFPKAIIEAENARKKHLPNGHVPGFILFSRDLFNPPTTSKANRPHEYIKPPKRSEHVLASRPKASEKSRRNRWENCSPLILSCTWTGRGYNPSYGKWLGHPTTPYMCSKASAIPVGNYPVGQHTGWWPCTCHTQSLWLIGVFSPGTTGNDWTASEVHFF